MFLECGSGRTRSIWAKTGASQPVSGRELLGWFREIEVKSNLDPRPYDQGSVSGQAEGLGGVGAQVRRGDEAVLTPCRHGRCPALHQLDLRPLGTGIVNDNVGGIRAE